MMTWTLKIILEISRGIYDPPFIFFFISVPLVFQILSEASVEFLLL
jgi:hypothetical protein